jgi:hypothetical protein
MEEHFQAQNGCGHGRHLLQEILVQLRNGLLVNAMEASPGGGVATVIEKVLKRMVRQWISPDAYLSAAQGNLSKETSGKFRERDEEK